MLFLFSGTFCPVDLALSPAGPWFCSLSAPLQVGSHTYAPAHPLCADTECASLPAPSPSETHSHASSVFLLPLISRVPRFHAFRMGRIPPLQREEVHRLRRDPPGDRSGDGSCHRRQQRDISRPHQPAGLLPTRCDGLFPSVTVTLKVLSAFSVRYHCDGFSCFLN